MRSVQKMIISTRSIYSKIFRILSLEIKTLDNVHFYYKVELIPSFFPPLYRGFNLFWTLAISTQTQVLQAIKVSFKLENVNVIVVRFRKNYPVDDSLCVSKRIVSELCIFKCISSFTRLTKTCMH